MLRVRGLTMRYPNGKRALAGFDLSVEAGELVVVLGGNGSGKTTLLRCISRMLSPTAGEIWLNDTNLAGLSGERLRLARLPLAMIWQHASLVRRRSVLSNVAAGALGRYGGVWTALGGLARGRTSSRLRLPACGWPRSAGRATCRYPLRRAGATRCNRPGACPAPAGAARRRAGGEPRPRSSRRHHAPAAPPGRSGAPRRVVRVASGGAGLFVCRPRCRHSRRHDRFRSAMCRAVARRGAPALSK